MEVMLRVRTGADTAAVAGNTEKTLLAALTAGGFTQVEAPCGGRGRCGKCLVTVTGPVRSLADGSVRQASEERLLACRFAPAGACAVTVPEKAAMTVVMSGAGDIGPAGETGLGLAVDIGTTTVAVLLYDMAGGRLLAGMGERNAQRLYGADVVSRITACASGGLVPMRDGIREQITAMARELCRRAGRDPSELCRTVIAGNTVMEHLFDGLDPTGIGTAPFTPESLFGDERDGGLCLPGLGADRPALLCPCVSGYVGGDITAGLLACGADRAEELWLYADIGTNGEMALVGPEGIVTCATAAGPAFEGAEIACGMDGSPGAVDRVWVENGEIRAHVIGGGPALGLCGSGLIDAVAALLEAGVIDETGRMAEAEELPPVHGERIFLLEDGTRAFRLRDGVYLAARDVRQVQLAKAAIRAGAETLLSRAGKTPGDIRRLLIAGGFGSFMDKNSALRIGLLPPVDPARIEHVGNAAGAGAALALTPAGRDRLAALTARCGYLELSSARDFMDRYIDCMLFDEEDGI